MSLNPEQLGALKQLSQALGAATDTLLFDSAEAWDFIHPDTINAFCEGVEKLEEHVAANLPAC